jgi:hypothetical protein
VNGAQLLSAWEAAATLPPAARAAALLERAGLVDGRDAALDLPVGVCAALASRLYADTFGEVLDGLVTCPACTTVLDVTVPLRGLPDAPGEPTTVVAPGGRELRVRAPTTRDLVVAGGRADPARALMAACVSDAAGAPADPDELGGEALDLVDAVAEELAGAAGVVVRATCPECAADVAAPLDVGALLWDRVARAAAEALRDVADLATAFGWSEADVLALTPVRRGAYLELVRGGP